jgi:Domain of unknown function (DUF4430)
VPTRLDATRRCAAAAIALVLALAAAGCGLGPGEELEGVELTVTRDYGAERLLGQAVGDAAESDTVMRVLERSTEIETRYGGGFVHSIDGLEATRDDGRYWDWLYYVNGVEAGVGAAAYELRGGEAIWWDYRDWTSAQRVPAVVGSWPHPFVDGYEGRRRPVAIECLAGGLACAEARARLERAGAVVAAGDREGATRVLVGPWGRVRRDPAAAQIEEGLQASGVFAELARIGNGFELRGLDEAAEPARDFGPRAGLVAATRRHESPPVWVVTGTSAAGVRAAAELLDEDGLRDHYAVAVEGNEEIPLPVR